MAARRSYSDEERAEALAALAANGGNVNRTAAQLGLRESTLRYWAETPVAKEVREFREEKKQDLAERLETLAGVCLDLLPDKLKEASAKDIAVTLGISVDKKQLLQGRPTEIQQQQVSEDDRKLRLAELLGRAEDRAGAPVPHAGRVGGGGPAAGDGAGVRN